MNKFLKMGAEQALKSSENKEGGPFGAVIVDKDNNIVACSNNRVLVDNDPTAHAEVTAIREACKNLATYDLTGCKIYSTCEPCPMCLSAIVWANIREVYYASTRIDAEKVGFRDKDIYDYFEKHTDLIKKIQIDDDTCKELMETYQSTIY